MGQLPHAGLEPRPGGTSAGRMAQRRHPDHGCPRHQRGAITHARLAATLAVAQRRQQSPKWVVCTFSLADAHIASCDPRRLTGPEAMIPVADCARMIVKELQEGDHHSLLLQAGRKDHAKVAKPGLWPEAALPADLELQLAVPTTVYHLLQAFHDLRWRGKPDRNSAPHTGRSGYRQTRSTRPLRPWTRTNSAGPRCICPCPQPGAAQVLAGQDTDKRSFRD